jgi:hypothetical protein
MPQLSGPVFLSHASQDKEFVRRLDQQIKEAGYATWLDEHQMVPGDALPNQLGTAIGSVGAFVVVVSSAALRSRWLPYELQLATHRSITGRLRIIPVLLEDVTMPAEITHLLYADFTGAFDAGFGTLLNALTREAALATTEYEQTHLYAAVNRLIMEVFDWSALVPYGNEYESLSFSAAGIDLPDGRELQVVVETEDVHGQGNPPRPLSATWLSEFLDAQISQIELYSLVVSRRPLELGLPVLEGTDGRVKVKSDRLRGAVYLVDVSDRPGSGVERRRMESVRADIERREATASRRAV